MSTIQENNQNDEAQLLDDHAVDLFAAAMKEKLAKKRLQGFGGWHDISTLRDESLTDLLLRAVAKGDPVDVGNFAMMLFCRNDSHDILKETMASADSECALSYPATATPELLDVLGIMNFRTGPIAHLFRAAGHYIPRKCESEQAFVLDRLIRTVLRHGANWHAEFSIDLKAAARKISAEKAPT
ncbi:hypothetical protein [Collimonas sp.]|jgi:hypothetical protein|uniref:hypothetical protein n=1 Tax=Collimonas sp. TaxID=1963772 RepID=UPI0037C0944B